MGGGTGAFALPVSLEPHKGAVDIVYSNSNWIQGAPPEIANKTVGDAIAAMFPLGSPGRFEDGGIYRLSGTYLPNKTSAFLRLQNYSQEKGEITLKEFSYKFSLIQPFLLVLDADSKDNALYIYLDFYSTVSGNSLTRVSQFDLELNDSSLRCHLLSARALARKTASMDAQTFLSSVRLPEPLSIPVSNEYEIGNQRILADGKKAYGGPYFVQESDISEPSLYCWLKALGFYTVELTSCKNTGYAFEFIQMLNSGICASKGSITEFPPISYPYQVNEPGKNRSSYPTAHDRNPPICIEKQEKHYD